MKATIPYIIIIVFFSSALLAQENSTPISSSSFITQIPESGNLLETEYLINTYQIQDNSGAEHYAYVPEMRAGGMTVSWAEFLLGKRNSDGISEYSRSRKAEKFAVRKFRTSVTNLDTIVQLNVINVFGDYLALAGISLDTASFIKDLVIEKEQYASLSSDVFLKDDFEYRYGRPYFDFFATPEKFSGGYNALGFIHSGVMNSISINICGISNAMMFGSLGQGNGVEVTGNLNTVIIKQH